MTRYLTSFIFALAVMCTSNALGSTEASRPTVYVSMVRLLINQDDYANYAVAVSGYLNEHGTHLFLSAEHAQLNDIVSGFQIAIAYRDDDISENGRAMTGCEGRFVRVFGVFEKHNNEFLIAAVHKIVTYDKSAGLNFEGYGPTGGASVCWRR